MREPMVDLTRSDDAIRTDQSMSPYDATVSLPARHFQELGFAMETLMAGAGVAEVMRQTPATRPEYRRTALSAVVGSAYRASAQAVMAMALSQELAATAAETIAAR